MAELAAGLRSGDAEATLRGYYGSFFGPHDSPERKAWVLDEAVRTAPYVTASALEESVRSWDDAEALARCQVPVLYLDAGTENANLARATELCPQMVLARTVGSGHFSPVEVPDQVNAMLERFIAMCR